MQTTPNQFILLVHDVETAVQFYNEVIGFQILIDQDSNDRRFVYLAQPDRAGAGFWLQEANGDEQRRLVGQQGKRNPVAILYTTNCRETYETLRKRGVNFHHHLRRLGNEWVALFTDLYGNEFALIEIDPTWSQRSGTGVNSAPTQPCHPQLSM